MHSEKNCKHPMEPEEINNYIRTVWQLLTSLSIRTAAAIATTTLVFLLLMP